MQEAADKGVHVILFPETALTGYGPDHFETLEGYDWEILDYHTKAICRLASILNIWVVLGSMRHQENDAPKNCLYVISNKGEIVGTYDKRRLYGKEKKFYSPGRDPLVVEINGYKCGFLICYDNCYPELYDAYRGMGVGLLFHSFHNAANHGETNIKKLMLANLMVRAADNQMWIAASNSSRRYSPLQACVVRPDSSMVSTKRNVSGFVVDDYPVAELGWTYNNQKI
jgi:predicted amidohydrolase